MWSRVLGKATEKPNDSASSSSRRKTDDDQRSQKRNRAESIASSATTQKASRSDERDRGFNPTSTSYSSSSRSPYPGAASASIASSYATAASNTADQPIIPPDLVRNASLADQMPKSQTSRDDWDRVGDREHKNGRRRERSTSRDRKSDRKDRSRSRDRDGKKREKKEKRERRSEKEGRRDHGLSRSESGLGDYQGASRAGEIGGAVEGSFNTQIGASGFTQFPGQYDGGMPGPSSGPPRPTHMSDHVPDQFPGQFPTGSTAPYRPPLAVNEGGPGLAADYYGDAGESVAQQPGVRPQAPSLIVGAEPHLMAASPTANPPPEPSATGGVGAAASFFSGASFASPSTSPKPSPKPDSASKPPYTGPSPSAAGAASLAGVAALTYGASTQGGVNYDQSATSVTNNSFYAAPSSVPPQSVYSTGSIAPTAPHHSSSAPILPTLGSAVAGAAAGYAIGSHTSSSNQQHVNPMYSGNGQSEHRPPLSHPAPSQPTSDYGSYTENNRPSKTGEHHSHSSIPPLYAAAALGAAGVGAAYYHNHHSPHDISYSGQPHQPSQQFLSTTMAHKHKHHGPLDKFVEFFRDPDGVAQFEEYSEIIGVCRYCFAPGSSPRDAPRKHHYKKKRSNERLGSSIRVDKESRYYSSDNEKRRKNNNNSWLATGIAGYGLAQVGKSLFGDNRDFDDTYSVKSGRVNYSTTSLQGRRHSRSPDRKSRGSHGVTRKSSDIHSSHRSRSRDRIETGITSDGKIYKKVSHEGHHGGPSMTTYSDRRRSRSRSRSRNRKSGLAEAAIGAAIGSSVIASTVRKRSKSPKKSKHRSRSRSRERRSVVYVKDDHNGRSQHKPHHSPRSSYVEMRRQSPKQETGIFGGFFSPPPETKKRSSHKKKQKTGFFNFGNSSSSSSDSALAFGVGSDRSRGKRSSKPRIKDHQDAQNAVLGLGAAAAALAATEARKGDKGKRRADVVAVKDVKNKHSTSRQRHDGKRNHSRSREEDGWESASEGQSSVDSTLAYGVHRRGSSSSLRSDSSGTGKWGWRWGTKKEKKRSPKPTEHFPYAAAGAAAGVAAGATLASRDYHHDSVVSSSSNLPPLQHVPPMPIYDSPHHDYAQNPMVSPYDPLVTSRPAPIPIQHPQPIAPVSSSVYTTQAPTYHSYSAPTGATVFSERSQPPYPSDYGHGRPSMDARHVEIPSGFPESYTAQSRDITRDKKTRRRDSSPTPKIVEIEPKLPRRSSTRDDSGSVRFDFTREQEEKDRRREREREHEHREKALRKEAEEQEHLEREKRRARRRAEKAEDKARREKEYEREVDRSRKQEGVDPKHKGDSSWAAPALAGIAGAAIGAAAATKERSSSSEERREKRKEEERRKSEDPEYHESESTEKVPSADEADDILRAQRESVIARRAAALVRRTPSPAHEEYASFFAPAELLSKSADDSKSKSVPDDDDDVASHIPQIITIEPAEFRDLSALPYTLPRPGEDEHYDPTHIRPPWMYAPSLRLIKPTPPGSKAPSTAGSVKGDASPVIHPVDDLTKDEPDDTPSKGKVTFGKSETREYDVVTPEDHREEFIESARAEKGIPGEDKEAQESQATRSPGQDSPVEEITREHMPGEFGDDLDFAATLAAGLHESGFDPNIVIDNPSFRRRTSPPGSDDERTFQPTVYDIADDFGPEHWGSRGIPPQRGFVEGELPPTPKDETKPVASRGLDKHDSETNGKDGDAKERLMRSSSIDDTPVPLSISPLGSSKDRYFDAGGHAEEPEIIEAVPRNIPRDFDDGFVELESRKRTDKYDKTDTIKPESPTHESPVKSMGNKDEFFDASEARQEIANRISESDLADKAHDVPLADDDVDDFAPTSKKGKKYKRSRREQERKLYESPDEDNVSNAATAPLPDNFSQSKKSKKKSKRGTVDFDDSASVASSPAKFDDAKETNGKSKKDKKGGLFGIFSKSTEDSPESKVSKDSPKEATFDDFEEPKKKGKKSKSRKSTRDTDDFYSLPSESVPDLDDAGLNEKNGTSSLSNGKTGGPKDIKIDGESGRTTQELPTKDRDLTESEVAMTSRDLGEDDPGDQTIRTKAQDQPLSFLGVRQEITEPPDIEVPQPPSPRSLALAERAMYDEVSSRIVETAFSPHPERRPTTPTTLGGNTDLPASTTSRPGSPMATPVGHRRRLSMLQMSDGSHPVTNSSPTAVPLHFRGPPSMGLTRSSPSTPSTASQGTPMPFPRSRQPRPHSTEFKSSTEFRPLWLVEQVNSSRREPPQEDNYPSLPASHSTSRASSVHGLDDRQSPEDSDYAVTDKQDLSALEQDTADRSDLLDSQQATPTAASFDINRDIEPAISDDTHIHEDPSAGKEIASGILAGGVAAVALGSIHQRRSSRARTTESDIPRELVEPHKAVDQAEVAEELVSLDLIDKPNFVDQSESDAVVPHEEPDFFVTKIDKKKKDKKQKKGVKTTVDGVETPLSSGLSVSEPSTPSNEVQSLSLEEQRKHEEQDTQDAIASWFDRPSTKKDKKAKKKGRGLSASETAEASTSLETKTDAPTDKLPSILPTASTDNLTSEPLSAMQSSDAKQSEHQLSKGMSESELMGAMAAAAVAGTVVESAYSKDQTISTQEVGEDEWSTSGSKSKKGKKQKGKKSASISLSGSATPVDSAPSSGPEWQGSKELSSGANVPTEVGVVSGVVALPKGTEDVTRDFEATPADEPAEPAEEVFPITKKTKKGKKKSLASEDRPTRDLQPSDDLSVPAIPDAEVAASDLPAFEDAKPSKKSKKGKKGRKVVAFDDFEEAPVSAAERSRDLDVHGPQSSILADKDITGAVHQDIHALAAVPREDHDLTTAVTASDQSPVTDKVEVDSSILRDIATEEGAARQVPDAGTVSREEQHLSTPTIVAGQSPGVEMPEVQSSGLTGAAISETPSRDTKQPSGVAFDIGNSGFPKPTSVPSDGRDKAEVHPSAFSDTAIEETVHREIHGHSEVPHRGPDRRTPMPVTDQIRDLDERDLQPSSTTEAIINEAAREEASRSIDTSTEVHIQSAPENKFRSLFSPEDVALPVDDDVDLLESVPEVLVLDSTSTLEQTSTPALDTLIAPTTEHLSAQTKEEKRRSSDLTQVGLSGEPEYVAHNFPQPVELSQSAVEDGEVVHKPMSTLDNTPRFEKPPVTEISAHEDAREGHISDTSYTPAREDDDDYFAFPSTKKGKKEKKGRRSQPGIPADWPLLTGEEPSSTTNKSATSVSDPEQPPENGTIHQEAISSNTLDKTTTQVALLQAAMAPNTTRLESATDVRDFADTKETDLNNPRELDLQVPATSLKENDQQHDMHAPSPKEIVTATTGTADEVREMLRSDDPSSTTASVEPTAPAFLPDPIAEESRESTIPEDEWGLTTKKESKKGNKSKFSEMKYNEGENAKGESKMDVPSSLALTDTAAEVRSMLTAEDVPPSKDQTTKEVADKDDEFFPTFSKKKKGKKGKKNNRNLDDSQDVEVVEAAPTSTVEDSTTTPEVLDIEPMEEFSMPKSKKDKKNKRKALSRTVSDLQDTSAIERASRDIDVPEVSSSIVPRSPASDTIALDEALRAPLPQDPDDDLFEAEEIQTGHSANADVGEVPHEPLTREHVLSSEQEWAENMPTNFLEEAIKSPLPQDKPDEFFDLEQAPTTVEVSSALHVEGDEAASSKLRDIEKISSEPHDGDLFLSKAMTDEEKDKKAKAVDWAGQPESESSASHAPTQQLVEVRKPEIAHQSTEIPILAETERPPTLPVDISRELRPRDLEELKSSLVSETEMSGVVATASTDTEKADIGNEKKHTQDPHAIEESLAVASSVVPATILTSTSDNLTGASESATRAADEPPGDTMPDDFEVYNLKKSKKDKKKAGKGQTVDLADESEVTVSSTVPYTTTNFDADGPSESATSEKRDTQPVQEPSSTEEPASSSLKMNKNNKRKARKGQAIELGDDPETAATSPLPETSAELVQRELIDTSETQGREPLRRSSLEAGEESFNTKKSKKDKKKAKRGVTLDLGNDTDPSGTPPVSEPTADVITRDLSGTSESSAQQPESVAISQPEETFSTKKGKKDKKKGKKGQFVPWEDEAKVSERPIAPEPSIVVSTKDLSDVPEISIQDPDAVDAAEPEEEILSLKNSKKDKKKAKKGQPLDSTNDSEVPATSPLPEARAEHSSREMTDVPESSTQDSVPASLAEPEEAFSLKKSKRDKKRAKKGQSFDWAEESEAVATSPLPENVSERTTRELLDISETNAGPPISAELSTEPSQEDFSGSKQSRKDKKKAKKKQFLTWDDESDPVAIREVSEPVFDAGTVALPESPIVGSEAEIDMLGEDNAAVLHPFQHEETEKAIEPLLLGDDPDQVEELVRPTAPQQEMEPTNVPAQPVLHEHPHQPIDVASAIIPRESISIEPPSEYLPEVTDPELEQVEPHPPKGSDSFPPFEAKKEGETSHAKPFQDFEESGDVAPPSKKTPSFDTEKQGYHDLPGEIQHDRSLEPSIHGAGLDDPGVELGDKFEHYQNESMPVVTSPPAESFGPESTMEMPHGASQTTTVSFSHPRPGLQIEPPIEDEFIGSVTKMKSTKDGKGMEQSPSSFHAENPQSPSSITDTTRSIDIGTAPVTTDVNEPAFTIPTPVTFPGQVPTITEQPSPAREDEWPEFGTTKRKKGKKDKKQQSLAREDGTATPASVESEALPISGETSKQHNLAEGERDQPPHEENLLEQSANHNRSLGYDLVSEAPLPRQLSSDNLTQSFEKDLDTLAPHDTIAPFEQHEEQMHHDQPSSEPIRPSDERPTEYAAKEKTYTIPAIQTSFGTNEPVSDSTFEVSGPSTRRQVQEEEAFPMSKKGRKNKKKSKGNALFEEDILSSASRSPGPSPGYAEVDVTESVREPKVELDPIVALPEQATSKEAVDAEESGLWDMPTTKKGKKNKKSNGSSYFEESKPSPAPRSPAQAFENAVPEPSVSVNATSREVIEDRPAPAQPLYKYPEASRTQPTVESAEVVEEPGGWDIPMTKKGKKEKKAKKNALEPRNEPEALESVDTTLSHQEPRREHSESYFNQNITLADIGHAPTAEQLSKEADELDTMPTSSQQKGHHRTGSLVGSKATVPGVGAGIALFESLQKAESAQESKKAKKKRKGSKWDEWQDERPEESVQEQPREGPSEIEHDVHSYEKVRDIEPLQMHIQESSSYPDFIAKEPGAGSPTIWPTEDILAPNRDSAVHVSDSPLPPEFQPSRYSVRDSGYVGTEASPTFATEPESHDKDLTHIQGSEQTDRSRALDDTNRSSMADSADNPLNISIEVDPAYEVSISRPRNEHGYQREISAVTEQLPTPQRELSHDEPALPTHEYHERQPSPVDSSTKDRSSVLFQSSPSTREDAGKVSASPQTSSMDHAEEASREAGPFKHTAEVSTPTRISDHQDSSRFIDESINQGPKPSLFGGPVGINSDVKSPLSPPRTPLGFDSSSRQPLNTISENSPEESPIHKHPRSISDVDSPERGVKSTRRSVTPQAFAQHRVRSPLCEGPSDRGLNSSDDIFARLSWPAVDEETHSVDLDRSKSRNTNPDRRSSSRHSNAPVIPIDLARHHDPDRRSISGASVHSGESISAIIRTPEYHSPGTPPLRRVDRSVSGDLRAASKRGEAKKAAKLAEVDLEAEPVIASSSTYDPTRDKGKNPITKMTDVYHGWGDAQGSPRSPTRPPSMRRRQSMQILDLETRLDQLVSENRLLQDAKIRAERSLDDASHDHSQTTNALNDAIQTRDVYLKQKDSQLDELRKLLENLQNEVSHLTQVNEGLTGARQEFVAEHEQRYSQLENQHTNLHQQWQESTRELDEMRQQHISLSSGMEGIVQHEVNLALEAKNAELRQMREELEAAKDQVRRLQQQISASRSSDDVLVARDEDYFDNQCQQLCHHVQQWVLRFSKFSDMKACRLISEIADEKITDRYDNAILDGSDVDLYLSDRIKRRDVFMSVIMTMVWEYIFTRYLFGMDREQRQKLKTLEKILTEAAPPAAVNKWRATTLTILAKREAFQSQREKDTEAVVQEIYQTLAVLLPPPTHLVSSILESLRKVMHASVDLSIEMRTQKAEYIMLPPLQPEYDINGDLARKVYFNSQLMNERSGDTISNDELVARKAVVRMVLFPLVVKKGDDDGVGSEEIVVCPAQVLVAKENERKKTVRVVSAQGDRMDMSVGNRSVGSFAPSSMDAGMGGMI